MRRLIWILTFLILSVFIGLAALKYHNGWIMLTIPPWAIQMPLWFGILSIAVGFFSLNWLLSSVRSLQFAWYRFRTWLRFRKGTGSYSKTQHGFLFLREGRWKKAESLLMQGAIDSPLPVINHLCAAQAAHELKQFSTRDRYLRLAHDETPEAHLAVAIVEAELKLSAHQYQEAITHLKNKLHVYKKHPQLLKLLFAALEADHQYETLLTFLPAFKQTDVISKTQAEQLELECYLHQFNSIKDDILKVKSTWKNTPAAVRSHPKISFAYCLALFSDQDQHAEIEKLIRQYLKYQYDASLVELYARLNAITVQRQLVILGAWLKQHGQHPALLMALGRTCTQGKLWGRAKEYYQSSLEMWRRGGDSDCFLLQLQTLREYGQLLESLGEHDKARTLYGLELDKILDKNYNGTKTR